MHEGEAPTFSVVIAAYEAAAFIGDAVSSALDQDPPPLELIVGDDGSTDDLAGALAPFGDAVTLVRLEHGGEATAKNGAAARARGEFIAFLDADDRFLPGRLRAMGDLIRSDPGLDIVTTDAWLVHGGAVVGRCYSPGHLFAHDDQRRTILSRNFVFGLAAVRRELFAAAGGFDPAIADRTDWDLWMRLVLDGARIELVPEPLAEYRLHAGSMSVRRAAMAAGRLATLAKAAARTDLTPDERDVVEVTARRERANHSRATVADALVAGDRARIRSVARSLATSPGQRISTRVKAVAAMLAPGWASRRARAEEARTFATVGDRRLARR